VRGVPVHHKEIRMQRKLILTVLVAALASGQGFAIAQGNDSERMSRTPQQAQREMQQGRNQQARQPNRGQGNNQGRNNQGRNNQGWNDQGRNDQARDERGAGPEQNFRRGGRLPPEYRGRQYVVDDWRGHHLSAPPRGYQWVQTGGDYVLIAIATGIIAQLLLGNN
jgi:Ni/Co efflux regulator RcnB